MYTIEEIKEAYNKLRAYVYYDSGELLLREKIVVFETDLINDSIDFLKVYFNNDYSKYLKDKDGKINIESQFISSKVDLEKKLEIITDRLNNYHIEPDFFSKYISEVDIKIFPKIFSAENQENKIISNRRIRELWVAKGNSFY